MKTITMPLDEYENEKKAKLEAAEHYAKKNDIELGDYRKWLAEAEAKLTTALEREAKLVEALEFAASEIHNEFCGQAHHKYCIVTDAALAENKKVK